MAHTKFIGYKVSELEFKINTEAQAEKNFKINPKIRFDIKKNPQAMLMTVTVTIDKNQPTPTPFELNVAIVGSFEITQEADINTLRIEASNFLFPYVRATVSGVTALANMPPYYLPLISFDDMKQEEPRKNESVIIRPLEDLD